MTLLRSTKPGSVRPSARSSGLRTRTPLIAIRPSLIVSTIRQELKECPSSLREPEPERDAARAFARPRENSTPASQWRQRRAPPTQAQRSCRADRAALRSLQTSGSETRDRRKQYAPGALAAADTSRILPSSHRDGKRDRRRRRKGPRPAFQAIRQSD